MKRLGLTFTLLALLALVAAANASAKGLQRHENPYWTWYAPAGWVDAHSANGIDITSPTGVYHVGYGFSGTAGPVTHDQVVDLIAQLGGLDSFALVNLVFTSRSKPFAFAGGQRVVLNWKAKRKGGPRIRGVLKVDVFGDAGSGAYGFASTSYDAPRPKWAAKRKLLAKVSKLIFYHPQSPF